MDDNDRVNEELSSEEVFADLTQAWHGPNKRKHTFLE